MPQVAPLQTGFPLTGSAQASQPVAVHPEATLLLVVHVVGFTLGQPCVPASQVTLQVVPLQLGVPFAGSAHATQPVALHPEATLLLATHVPVAVPPTGQR